MLELCFYFVKLKEINREANKQQKILEKGHLDMTILDNLREIGKRTVS